MRFETFWQASSEPVPGFDTSHVAASLELYCKMVEPAIRTAFPGAEVQATWIGGDADPQVEVVATWGPANQPVEDLIAFGKRVEAICQSVWKEGDWILPAGWDQPGGYPAPDRSKQTRILELSADDDQVDLGWKRRHSERRPALPGRMLAGDPAAEVVDVVHVHARYRGLLRH